MSGSLPRGDPHWWRSVRVLSGAAPSLPTPFIDAQTHHVFLAGALGTAAVLMGGLVAFKKGNKQLSQTMMRARIIAQGATVAIMLGTSGA